MNALQRFIKNGIDVWLDSRR